ncbi:MAG: hypothetical protein ABI091_14760 [Ferruginibacter sp.]
MNPNGMKYRYEFERIVKNGIPYLQVKDNYLAPVVVNTFLFKYEGVCEEQNGYGAQMIDRILKMLDTEYSVSSENINHRVFSGSPMDRVSKLLKELEYAIEEYDDRSGSKSKFIFTSFTKYGESFTTEIKNNLIKS